MTRFQCLVLTEVLLIIAVGVLTWSIIMPNWLIGGGSKYMYPPGLTQGFSTRQYGLVYVEGLRKQTWAQLASSICDRWGMYLHTKSLYVTASNCASNVKAADCTAAFETHLRDRCEIYSDMTLLSFVIVGVLSVAVLLVGISSILMLVVSVAKWKRMLLAGLMSGFILSLASLVTYGVFSTLWFRSLASTGTFPLPQFNLGFILCGAGMLMLAIASFVFYRLSAGLKFNPNDKKGTAVGTAALLDLAEAKFVDSRQLENDDIEEESTPPFTARQ